MFSNSRRVVFGNRKENRRGTVIIMAAILCMILLGMVAFAVDIGYVCSAKEEIQRSADAAALAACWEYGQRMADGDEATTAVAQGRLAAGQVAGLNEVSSAGPAVAANAANSPEGDVVFGYVSDLSSPSSAWNTSAEDYFNVVRVRLRRDANLNGEIPLFFARVFGRDSMGIQAEATAAIVRDVRGFRTPASGGNLGILPISLDLVTLNQLLAGATSDVWTWNAATGQVEAGADGIREVNLYPQGTGAPGNRGMVDIGSNNNSTSDIARQILYGISPEDMAHHNGTLELDANGELLLNGDTGISAGVKDELLAIKGEPRIIPIFREVNGPGNNAMYTIVQWLGIRILDVKLTGSMNSKRLTIQPAPMVTNGVIPSTSVGTSSYVYSPVVLLQ